MNIPVIQVMIGIRQPRRHSRRHERSKLRNYNEVAAEQILRKSLLAVLRHVRSGFPSSDMVDETLVSHEVILSGLPWRQIDRLDNGGIAFFPPIGLFPVYPEYDQGIYLEIE